MKMLMRQPIKFLPYLKTTIWGGEKISRFKNININCKNIGESWELSGVQGCESIVTDGDDCGMTLSDLVRKYKHDLVGKSVYDRYGDQFPLLVKFIDARDDLSLQVHPDDTLAMRRHNSFGKTEMWYIIETGPDARIHSGLTRTIDKTEYEQRVRDHTLMDVVGCHDSAAGDLFFLPAGRLHAIGAGNFLVEIQQSSDITYRVDDYDRRDADGNPRQLHTDLAKDAIDYAYYPDCKSRPTQLSEKTYGLVSCEYFKVNRETVDGERRIVNPDDSFMGIVCIGGNGSVKVDGIITNVRQGETLLLPAGTDEFDVEGSMTLITFAIPTPADKSVSRS